MVAVFDSQREIPPDMFRQLSVALLAATVSMPLASAQRRGATGTPVSVAHAGFARGAARGIGLHHGTRPLIRGFLLGSPWPYTDYDPNDTYVVEGAPSQFVIVQPASVDDSPRKTRPKPLLIEWHGDRYVRFGGAEETAAERGASAHPDYAEPALTKLRTGPPTKLPMSATQKEPTASQPGERPPAVLVYRDGHREEIPDYAIADGVIYVRGNDWQNGYWTKRIPLSALDPPATMQANQQRGVKFLLPSAPNVVIASF
jgi:hypothetical protein